VLVHSVSLDDLDRTFKSTVVFLMGLGGCLYFLFQVVWVRNLVLDSVILLYLVGYLDEV